MTTEHTVERQEKWEPIDGIVTPAATALIAEDHHGLRVTLLFSEIVDGGDSDLSLIFGREYSEWMASLENFLLIHPESLHYRPLTLDRIVDVLCSEPPEVSWISSPRA
jgi:hypothetical protein